MAGHTPQTIIIIGAGIIGLTTALSVQSELDKTRYNVLIVAREWPTQFEFSVNYASMWAGAHVRPVPASTPQLSREAAWLRETVAVFERQVQSGEATGVFSTPGVEYIAEPSGPYLCQNSARFTAESGLTGYRQLAPDELPAGTSLAFSYNTFCINGPVYCASLLRAFILRGGKTMSKHLVSGWEAFELGVPNASLVVNCSGIGFGDTLCYPIRGQTVLTSLSNVKETVTRQNADGTWTFIIPRFMDGGTVIGGTKEPHDWAAEPRASTRKDLLSAAYKQCGQLALGSVSDHLSEGESLVIRDIVGRRPARVGGVRLETEIAEGPTAAACPGKSRVVVHAYGAGGRGYEIAWGVARDVTRLVEENLFGERRSHL